MTFEEAVTLITKTARDYRGTAKDHELISDALKVIKTAKVENKVENKADNNTK